MKTKKNLLSQYIVLSPNEQAALEKKVQEEGRRKRLLQVREEEKRLAALRRRQYQNAYKSNYTVLASEVQEDLVLHKADRMKSLQDSLEAALVHFGEAYQEADKVNAQEEKELNELYFRLEENYIREIERYESAEGYMEEEEHQRYLKYRAAIDHLYKTRLQEQSRSRQLAHLYAETKPEGFTPSDIPVSMPLHAMNEKLRASLPPQARYDATYFHRDYNVVRTDGLERDPQANAVQAARKMSKEFAAWQKEQEMEKEIRVKEANERYGHAFHDIVMEREHQALIRQLDELKVQDRHRKKNLALSIQDPYVPLPPDFDSKQKLLTQFFDEKFTVMNKENAICSRILRPEDDRSADEQEVDERGRSRTNESHAWSYRSSSPVRILQPRPRPQHPRLESTFDE